MSIHRDLHNLLIEKGASLVGYADLGEIDADARDGLPYGVSIGVALNPGIISGISRGPTQEYFDEYHRANRLLADLSRNAADFLGERGFKAKDSHPTEGNDPETLATILPHKTVATRAGLGWIGKCALLVTWRYGSAVRLTTVLTDAEILPGKPVNTSYCGRCHACVAICPGAAPSGESWRAGMPRETFFNAHSCRGSAREMALKMIGEEITICGLCIVSCPWTKKYLAKHS